MEENPLADDTNNSNNMFVLPANQQDQQQQLDPRRTATRKSWRLSRWYGLASAVCALLAIVTSQQEPLSPLSTSSATRSGSVFFDTSAAEESSSSSLREHGGGSNNNNNNNMSWLQIFNIGGNNEHHEASSSESKNNNGNKQQNNNNNNNGKPLPPPWLRWLLPPDASHNHHNNNNNNRTQTATLPLKYTLRRWCEAWIDPTVLSPSLTTITDLLDKILTSTPRLLAIANVLLACTYLLHGAVAEWFLGPQYQQHAVAAAAHVTSTTSTTGSRGGRDRERLGGYLVFKLLLISAVVAPDTLDLLILLSWYTLLSFLRSLAHLCQVATQQAMHNGQVRLGVLQLLTMILMSDILAASVCVALFHGAGWNMVALLTCDNVLLGLDVLGYMLTFVAQVWEQQYTMKLQEMEQDLSRLNYLVRRYEVWRRQGGSSTNIAGQEWSIIRGGSDEDNVDDDMDYEDFESTDVAELEENVRVQERRLESLEQLHAKRLSVLDMGVFGLQIMAHVLTIAHFLHIWVLHGVQFTLIDGVLALHLHSAVAAAMKKVEERCNMNRIARDLNGRFEDATEFDLRKAALSGDVCCICLASMNSTAQVKKVGCGHLYHTSCLREVVERARSLEAARCPLCRASMMDGRQPEAEIARSQSQRAASVAMAAVEENAAAAGQHAVNIEVPPPRENERALFRFSTEDIFPMWLPLPAFSFEIVRRPMPDPADPNQLNGNNNNNNGAALQPIQGGQAPPQQEVPRLSMFRRLLILAAGAVPMSAEEEAAALAQLVDMFPQYDRSDLSRELRNRGSAEAVAETILMGNFTAMARGRY